MSTIPLGRIHRQLENSLLQKLRQPGNKFPFNIPGPAFPDDKDLPAICGKLSTMSTVSRDITVPLLVPEFCVRRWGDSTEATTMSMPKASMHKDDLPVRRQNKIRSTRHSFHMKSVTKSHLVNKRPNNHFRLRIFRSNPRHIERSLLGRMHIGHENRT